MADKMVPHTKGSISSGKGKTTDPQDAKMGAKK
jgi:hypothetical protein